MTSSQRISKQILLPILLAIMLCACNSENRESSAEIKGAEESISDKLITSDSVKTDKNTVKQTENGVKEPNKHDDVDIENELNFYSWMTDSIKELDKSYLGIGITEAIKKSVMSTSISRLKDILASIKINNSVEYYFVLPNHRFYGLESKDKTLLIVIENEYEDLLVGTSDLIMGDEFMILKDICQGSMELNLELCRGNIFLKKDIEGNIKYIGAEVDIKERQEIVKGDVKYKKYLRLFPEL